MLDQPSPSRWLEPLPKQRTVAATAPQDCTACGACCFAAGDEFVRLTGEDHARLGGRAAELSVFVENRAYMKMVDHHCAALIVGSDGRLLCSVYEQRSAICRELERGSPACLGELALKSGLAKELRSS